MHMRTSRLVGVTLGLVIGMAAGCSDEGKQEVPQEPASKSAKADGGSAAKRKREPKADAAAQPEAEASQEKPELRFDMTQDGAPQTAEAFDAWMESKGVRVAEGASADTQDDAKSQSSQPVVTKEAEAGRE